mmetsp:Transcript_47506/g.111061  ORF Transcript_47506/g.111061 Transcript_47506/m.111061 type:complete len:266 (+) Transcript_47506:200-997(+)
MPQLPLVLHMRAVAVAQAPESVPLLLQPLAQAGELNPSQAIRTSKTESRQAGVDLADGVPNLTCDQLGRICFGRRLFRQPWAVVQLDRVQTEVDLRIVTGAPEGLDVLPSHPVLPVLLLLVTIQLLVGLFEIPVAVEEIPSGCFCPQSSQSFVHVLRPVQVVPIEHTVERLQLRQWVALFPPPRGDGEEALVCQSGQECGIPNLAVTAVELKVVEVGEPDGRTVAEAPDHLIEVHTQEELEVRLRCSQASLFEEAGRTSSEILLQ